MTSSVLKDELCFGSAGILPALFCRRIAVANQKEQAGCPRSQNSANSLIQ